MGTLPLNVFVLFWELIRDRLFPNNQHTQKIVIFLTGNDSSLAGSMAAHQFDSILQKDSYCSLHDPS